MGWLTGVKSGVAAIFNNRLGEPAPKGPTKVFLAEFKIA
jgi:hypothetical protein